MVGMLAVRGALGHAATMRSRFTPILAVLIWFAPGPALAEPLHPAL